ncbi:MAG: heme-binding domain-containing protein [Ferruginibacter sp.]
MSGIKKIILALVTLFIAIQFIQPARNNNNGQVLSTDISKTFPVPDRILDILINSCYDCHSNNTRYPWYSYIQPGGWWMASHIKNAKADLNFSDFGSYSSRKQQNKLRSIGKSIADETMPIKAYMIIHTDAKLSHDQSVLVLDWIKKTRDSLSLKN